MSIPFSTAPTTYIEPNLPWKIVITVEATRFDLIKYGVADLAKHVACAVAPKDVSMSGAGSGGAITDIRYSITLSTPLEAEIEEAERHLLDLRRRLEGKSTA